MCRTSRANILRCSISTAVAGKTGRRVKALLPVHVLGHPVDMEPLMSLAREFGLTVIEDATESLGATYQEKPEVYEQASPLQHVRAGAPPTIFIEGERDTLKVGRAEMQEKLRALGIETELHTLKEAPHPFWMSQPWCDQVVDIASAFFKKHLGEPKF